MNKIFVLACLLSCAYGLPANKKADDYEFICQQNGLFPDPFDCTYYHMCHPDDSGTVMPESIVLRCQPGYRYESSTHLCSARGSCTPIVGDCEEEGDMGPVEGDRYMYYKCLNGTGVLTPQLLKCEDGEQFINMECRDPIPPSGLDDEGKCIEDGQFAIADDCSVYNTCVEGEDPWTVECGAGQYYDPWKGYCETFVCSL